MDDKRLHDYSLLICFCLTILLFTCGAIMHSVCSTTQYREAKKQQEKVFAEGETQYIYTTFQFGIPEIRHSNETERREATERVAKAFEDMPMANVIMYLYGAGAIFLLCTIGLSWKDSTG